jgi:hypothetical protein
MKIKERKDKKNKLRSYVLLEQQGTDSVAEVRATFGIGVAKEYEEYLKVLTRSRNHSQIMRDIEDEVRSDILEGNASVAEVRATFGRGVAKEYEEYLKVMTRSRNDSQVGCQLGADDSLVNFTIATIGGGAIDHTVSTKHHDHDQGSPSVVRESTRKAAHGRFQEEMSQGIATFSEVTEVLGEECAKGYSKCFRNLSKRDRRSLYKHRRSSQRDSTESDERSRSRTRVSSSPPNSSYNREGKVLRADSRDHDGRHRNIDDDKRRHESYCNDSRRG